MSEMFALPVSESSQAARAIRLASRLAGSLGFNETEAGKVSIVASEMASNLFKHARDGQLLVRPLEDCSDCDGGAGIELMALDKGPGMVNVARFLRDGYSTTGSMGTGLGAIVRLSSLFDIHSVPGVGTALLARLWKKPRSKNVSPAVVNTGIGVVCLPISGESASGDSWAYDRSPERWVITVVDGLGHGPDAAAAAAKAVETFQQKRRCSSLAIIEAAHAGLHETRGAAMAVAKLEIASKMVYFTGIGNITGVILTSQRRHFMVSHNGILGHQVRKLQEFTYAWPEKALLVMHSDGLTSRWSLERYPGLIARHPGLIAGVLYRDFRRITDDVTVVVARIPAAAAVRSAE